MTAFTRSSIHRFVRAEFDPGGGPARRRRSDDADLRGDGAEGPGTGQRAHQGGAGRAGAGGRVRTWLPAIQRARQRRRCRGAEGGAGQAAHRLPREVELPQRAGVSPARQFAGALGQRGVPTPSGGLVWTHNDGPIAFHVSGRHRQDDRLTARYDRLGKAPIRLRVSSDYCEELNSIYLIAVLLR
jgi:hypothetical protein